MDLATKDPTGRIDILVYRLLEELGTRFAPREWPLLSPLAEQVASRFAPKKRARRVRDKKC